MSRDDYRVVGKVDAVDHHRRQMWKQDPATVSRSHRLRASGARASDQPDRLHAMCVRTR
jgi:hypothetical protein